VFLVLRLIYSSTTVSVHLIPPIQDQLKLVVTVITAAKRIALHSCQGRERAAMQELRKFREFQVTSGKVAIEYETHLGPFQNNH
jgi:hypothetical protein